MALSDVLLKPMTMALNQYLQLDAKALLQLSLHQGKTLEIYFEDLSLSTYLTPEQTGISLNATAPAPIISKLSGNFWSILQLGINDTQSNRAAFGRSITLSGDMEFAQTLKNILECIEIDWEEQLSHYLGDTPAYHLSRGFSRAKAFFQDRRTAWQENLKEYIHFEAGLLPTSQECEQFYHDVDTLRADVDRLSVALSFIRKPYETR